MSRTLPETGLLPCPFCGGKPSKVLGMKNGVRTVDIMCDDCSGSMPAFCEEDAVEDWNTRPGVAQSPDTRVREALERLHKAVKSLARIGKNNVTLFEDSPLKSEEAFEAWEELNDAQCDAHNALGFRLLFDNEWLRSKIATDPDIECEAGPDLAAPKSPALDPAAVEATIESIRDIADCEHYDLSVGAKLALAGVRDVLRRALLASGASNADTSTHRVSPASFCGFCDLEYRLHEDHQGFHHVVKGERVPCNSVPQTDKTNGA